MKKLLSVIISLAVLVVCFASCGKESGEFNGIVIGSYKDYISVTTLDDRVDFYDANISINVSSLDFKVKNGQVITVKYKDRGSDDFDEVKLTPESVTLMEYQTKSITVEEAYNIKDTALFIDARSKDEYDMGHIENALCLTYKTMEKNYKELLTDTNKKLIVYAGSEETAALTAGHLIAFGYKEVYVLGDIDKWTYELAV